MTTNRDRLGWVLGLLVLGCGEVGPGEEPTATRGEAVGASACQPRGSGFHFVEQSWRLPADTSEPGTSTTDIDAVDVDGDGDLDLFISEGTDSVAGRVNRLLINDGRGFFSDEGWKRLPPAIANSTKTDWADLDGDGDWDALVANLGPEQLLLNDGHGFFTDGSAQLPAALPLFEDISAELRLVDVDGDGDSDALVGNENPFSPSPVGGSQNRLWLNDGNAHFVDATAARLPPRTDQTGAILGGDLDQDGDLDLVVLNRGQDYVLENDGSGFFSDVTSARFPTANDTSRGGALSDLDGDGDLDLVVANSRSEPVALYMNSDGVLTAGTFGHTGLPDETLTGLVVADLDRDGDDDVYLPNAGRFEVGHGFAGGVDRYYRNQGRGKFQERTERHLPGLVDPTTAASFADLDGDGDLDLVVGNAGEQGAERVLIHTRRCR